MNKALEILKNGVKLMEQAKLSNPESISCLDKEIESYNEAIAEIEFTEKTLKDMYLTVKDIADKAL